MGSEFKMIAIDRIMVKKERIRRDFGDLETLAADLQRNGLLKPILVNASDFSLIDGQRRLEAARIAGWSEICCHLKEFEEKGEKIGN